MLEIHLAKNIRYLRKQQKLSQAQLGSLLGLTRSNIASYENGNAEPSASKLARIARYFKMNLNQLIETDLEQLSDENFRAAQIPTYNRIERLQIVNKFEEKSDNLKKITDGFQAFYHLKINQLEELPKEINSLKTDFENVLNVMNNLVKSNEEMIDFLKTNEIK